MPELPEVEVVRSGLSAHVLGARIESVTVHDARSVRRFAPGPQVFEELLTQQTIRDISRRGKYLWISLDSDDALVVHLGMSGQVLLKQEDYPHEKHLKILCQLQLADGSALDLRFVDQRIFGGMYLDTWVQTTNLAGEPVAAASRSELGEARIPASVAHIARDPLDPHFDAEETCRKIRATRTGIKKLLLDQSVVSGVGNIYADEALWRARLHYAKPGQSLSKAQVRELLEAVRQVMLEALAAGGTSFDDLYVNVNGESGYFERGLNAYGRAGKPCQRCLEKGRTSLLVREPFGGRSSYRCPHCQRKPRGL